MLPRSWREGLHFVDLNLHYRKHSDLPRWEYLYQARLHTQIYGKRFKVYHEGQWKYNYITRIGPDQFILRRLA